MASITQQHQAALAPFVDRLDIQDWPLGNLRGHFDYLADLRVKACEGGCYLFVSTNLPGGLRMPLTLRTGHQVDFFARLLDVIDQNVAVRSPPFGTISHLHAIK